MVTTAEDVLVPPDRTAALWRYVDLTKFVSMLRERAIHFVRIDGLDDPWEGVWPAKTTADFRERLNDPDGAMTPMLKAPQHRKIFSASCWHESPYESGAMWKLYADRGLAIRSTYGALVDELSATGPVYGGRIQYGDPATISLRLDSMVPRFMWKRLSFAFEQEVRFLLPIRNGERDPAPGQEAEMVTAVPVDLTAVIDAVFVSPMSPPWVVAVIEDIVERFAHKLLVIHSDLERGPFK